MYTGIFETLELAFFFRSFIGKCMSSLFCRFLHDFYTFIEHMLPAYVADLGYCLLGKRPRFFYFLSERFSELFLQN